MQRSCLYLVTAALIFWGTAETVRGAAATVRVEVTSILASTAAAPPDPALAPLIKELQPLFRYGGYRRLGTHRMELALGQTGSAGLPGGRLLKVTPMRLQGGRVELALEILRGSQRIFHTLAQLRNRSSMVVGGPQHQDGVLLFRLYASF